MTTNEKEAILLYMESRLLDLAVQSVGSQCCIYMGIYDIMADMEQTLETQVEITQALATKRTS